MSKMRKFAVPEEVRYFLVGRKGLVINTIKEAGADEVFQLDWTGQINTDKIVASAWDVPPPLAGTNAAFSDFVTQIMLAGGVEGDVYSVKNTVTLASTQIMVRTIRLAVGLQ